MDWVAGILENIFADVVFVLLGLAVPWIILVVTKRRKLLRFYGIGEPRRIAVYLSNIRVKSFGAVGVDGLPRSYQGTTTPLGETTAANQFRDLFNYPLPSFPEPGRLMSKLLISDTDVQLAPAPFTAQDIVRSTSFITLGSPAYNIASRFVEDELSSQAKIRTINPAQDDVAPRTEQDLDLPLAPGYAYIEHPLQVSSHGTADISATARWPGVPREEHTSSSAIFVEGLPPITDTTYGFVERIIDHKRGRSVFYVAGLSELGTLGAAHFLAREWRNLHRRYRHDSAFVVLLRIQPGDYRSWSVVLERQGY